MAVQTILIAETDHRVLDILHRILSTHIPHIVIVIDTCTSADDLCRKNEISSYDAIAIRPILLQGYRFFKYKRDYPPVSPLIVTANQMDRTLASMFLQKDAFDVILKPIVPHEAVQTIALALWQNRLRKLLASKEKAWSRFQEHMETFPHARKAQEEFTSKLAAYERTFQALKSSMRLLLNVEDERALLHMATSVEQLIKKKALERLLNLSKEDSTP